jgi:hypothetical protein
MDEHPFRKRRLPCVNMREDADVPYVHVCLFFVHRIACMVSFLQYITLLSFIRMKTHANPRKGRKNEAQHQS